MRIREVLRKLDPEARVRYEHNIRLVKELRTLLMRGLGKWGVRLVLIVVGCTATAGFVATAQFVWEVFSIRNWELTWYWSLMLLVTGLTAAGCYREFKRVTRKEVTGGQ